MVRAKTGSFFLTETVTLPAASIVGSRVQGTIDLGAYVNVPTGQAIAIEEVDFIHQADADFGSNVNAFFAVGQNGAITTQLSDLNPGTLMLRADDQSLVASSGLNIDSANSIASHSSDMYPDNFGPSSLSDAFLVVNDSLYLVTGNDSAAIGLVDVYVTVRIKCRVVKLDSKAWMAIAIQSTASDN